MFLIFFGESSRILASITRPTPMCWRCGVGTLMRNGFVHQCTKECTKDHLTARGFWMYSSDRGCGEAQPQQPSILANVKGSDAVLVPMRCGWASPQPRSVQCVRFHICPSGVHR